MFIVSLGQMDTGRKRSFPKAIFSFAGRFRSCRCISPAFFPRNSGGFRFVHPGDLAHLRGLAHSCSRLRKGGLGLLLLLP